MEVSQQTELQVAERIDAQVGEPATGMVVFRQEESNRRLQFDSRAGNPGFSDQAARIPKAVVVLSPIAAGAAEQAPEVATDRERPSVAARRRARPLPGWRPITLGFLAMVGGYAGWLYLLYNPP